MELEVKQYAAVLRAPGIRIHTPQDALDLIAAVKYETGCTALVLAKEQMEEDFFRLGTGLAGEVLQKFINYGMRLALVGDFSVYTSKSLQDFIRESNRGKDIFFVPTEAEALHKLGVQA